MTTIFESVTGYWLYDQGDIVPPVYQNAGINAWNIYYATGAQAVITDVSLPLVLEIPYPTVRYGAHFSVVDVTYSVKATWQDQYGESTGLMVDYCRRNTETPTPTTTIAPTATQVPEYTNVNFFFHEAVYRPWAYRTPIN